MNGLRTMFVALLAVALLLGPMASSWAVAAHHANADQSADCDQHRAASHGARSAEPSGADGTAIIASSDFSDPAEDKAGRFCCELTCTPTDAVADLTLTFPRVPATTESSVAPPSVRGRIAGIDPPPPRLRVS